MRVNMLFGFLGSGKTTLARRILTERSGAETEKMAVIVNEFGDVGIDGAILEGQDVDMVELTSGCLCCTLKGSLLNAVEELRDKAGCDQVVIEATGVAQPEEMMETFSDPTVRRQFDIGPMVTVIDTPKFSKIRTMLGPFYAAQVENADILVLNKTDLASAEDLEAVRAEVTELNADAALLFAERCDIDVEAILHGDVSGVMAAYDGGHGEHHHDHAHDHDHDHDHEDHRHAPASSFVLDASAGAGRAALEAFFAGLGDEVWRAKGFLDIDGAPSLVQFAMGELEITPAEPREHHHMVFIGPDMDRASVEAGLKAAASDVEARGAAE